MSLGACRYCEYQPVASDAKRCPRCSGFKPNPSIIGWAISAVGLVIFILFALICAGAVWFAAHAVF